MKKKIIIFISIFILLLLYLPASAQAPASTLYFTTGHGGSLSGSEYTALQKYLSGRHFNSKSINLNKNGKIPADADGLVITNNGEDLSVNEKGLISAYLSKGGNAIFLFDPPKSGKRLANLETILKKYNLIPGYDKVKENDPQKHLVEDCYTFIPDMLCNEVIQKQYLIILTKSTSINIGTANKNARVIPLLRSSKKSFAEPISTNAKKKAGPLNIAAASEVKTGKITSRIVLIGGGSFVKDTTGSKLGSFSDSGKQFFSDILHWTANVKSTASDGSSAQTPEKSNQNAPLPGKDQGSVSVAPDDIKQFTVSNAAQFVNAIGSNRKIILKPGIYNLSEVQQIKNSDGTVTWKEVSDGKELNVNNVTNLTIEGSTNAVSEIRAEPRYACIFNFNNSHHISIKNIKAGHTPAQYMCDAGVVSFNYSHDIKISGSSFYGCGSVGLCLYNVNNFAADNTQITHCSLRAVDITNSQNVSFAGCSFKNNEAYANIILANAARNVTFRSCIITENMHLTWDLFELDDSSDVSVDSCKIFDNSKEYGYQEKVYIVNMDKFSSTKASKFSIRKTELTDNTFDSFGNDPENIVVESCTIANSPVFDGSEID